MAASTTHQPFFITKDDFEPAYMSLYRSGELKRRVKKAIQSLTDCHVCPRDCAVNRLEGKTAACKTGRYAKVASAFPHFGEEDCLRGWNGSGTIFFSMCNLRCVFCQNHDVSQDGIGEVVFPEQLAMLMLRLQAQGCHNINFVTPEHVVPQLLEALIIAFEKGLRLPIIYNTSAYDSMESLELLDGVVDIYMPDFKFWDDRLSLRYLKAKDYPEAARRVIREMHRQVGDLKFDEHGIAKRGVLVRHLVMPGFPEQSAAILNYLSEISPNMYVNVMDQYYPAGKVNAEKYAEINMHTPRQEYLDAVQLARQNGLRIDERIPRSPRRQFIHP